MYGYPGFPNHVYVELTNLCNARCTICATPAMKRKREIMPLELFRKIVKECGQNQAEKLLPFLHGESLLVPGVLDYFREARQWAPDTHINLTTNGSRLSKEMTESLLQEDLLDSVIISIDGGDKETFEGIRLGLDFDQIHQNVSHFIDRRDELGKSGPRVSISMVVVEENRETRRQLKEVWKKADEVRFSVYFNWAGKLDNEGRTPNKVNFCDRLYHYITILADGRVAMCCFDSEAAHAVGDIKSNSIREVWHSDQINQKRKLLYQKKWDQLPLCAGCDYINHPDWMTPALRLRPRLQDKFPQLVNFAGDFYKKWLTG